jgi:hypothetical protein
MRGTASILQSLTAVSHLLPELTQAFFKHLQDMAFTSGSTSDGPWLWVARPFTELQRFQKLNQIRLLFVSEL